MTTKSNDVADRLERENKQARAYARAMRRLKKAHGVEFSRYYEEEMKRS
jgi:hypothetical protein